MDAQPLGTVQSMSTYSESSRTGSSKSGVTDDKEKDRDFTKDNGTSVYSISLFVITVLYAMIEIEDLTFARFAWW